MSEANTSEIDFRGRLNEAEYLEMARFIWPTMLKLTPFFVFLGGLVLVWRSWPLSFDQPFRILQIAIVLAFGVAIALAPKLGARRAWKSDPILQEETFGSLSDQGLVWRQAERGIKLSWDAVQGYRTSPRLLLLYRTPRQFLYVPKSFFASESDWQAGLEIVQKHSVAR